MRKEMPVIQVYRVVDKKIIVRKNGGRGGGKTQGVC
jgi:hypothetical protein